MIPGRSRSVRMGRRMRPREMQGSSVAGGEGNGRQRARLVIGVAMMTDLVRRATQRSVRASEFSPNTRLFALTAVPDGGATLDHPLFRFQLGQCLVSEVAYHTNYTAAQLLHVHILVYSTPIYRLSQSASVN